MRNALLASAALLSLVAVSAPARAEGPFTLNIGGSVRVDGAAGSGLNGVDNGMRTDARFRLEAIGKSDAMTYGARFELKAETDEDVEAKRAAIFGEGAFGGFSVGKDYGAVRRFSVFSPTVAPQTMIDGNASRFGAAPVAVRPVDGDTAEKLFVQTPRWNGFAVGASFTPSTGRLGYTNPYLSDARFEDMFELGAGYDGTVGPFSLRLGATWSHAEARGPRPVTGDVTGWGSGGQVGYGDLTFGGGWNTTDLGRDDDLSGWNVGTTYALEPFTLGATFSRTTLERRGVDRVNDLYMVGASWKALPGLTFTGEAGWQDKEFDRNGAGGKDQGMLFLFGTRIDF